MLMPPNPTILTFDKEPDGSVKLQTTDEAFREIKIVDREAGTKPTTKKKKKTGKKPTQSKPKP